MFAATPRRVIVFSCRVKKVAVGEVFVATPRPDSAIRLRSPKSDVSFLHSLKILYS